MSKLSFRARALDAAKPLPVYRSRELPDPAACAAINRAVPQMPTGMEEDEEREHHLQRAISAHQVFREKKENLVIPVPEAESSTSYYDLYRGHAPLPQGLLHVQPLDLDQDQPDYDMDSEDELLLIRLNRKMEIRPLQFETMVDRLEKATSHQLVSLSEAKLLLNEEDYLLKSVYDYWVRKRRSGPGPPLTPHIRQERRDGSSSDAYVAFRRRTEKMQTRKNRKNDEASYQKMLRLRTEFSQTVTILEMIKRRETSKRELLHLTLEEVQRRYLMEDFSGESPREVLLPLVEKPAYCTPVTLNNRHRTDMKEKLPFDLLRPQKNPRRDRVRPPQRRRPPGPFTVNKADIQQYDFLSSGEDSPAPALSPLSSTDEEEENNPDGVYVFRRKAGCQYLSPGGDVRPGLRPPVRHSLAELVLAPHWTRLSRRRIGRGGRVLLDRASSGLDRASSGLDRASSSLYPVLKQRDSLRRPVCRTGRDPSPRDQNPSLTGVLSNMQTLRRFCFRPLQGPRATETSMGDNRGTCCRSPGSTSAGGITEQQYLSHQQQLIQMQQQLEKRQSPVVCRHRAQSSESSWKTLDSASAQFAASAVISAPLPPPLPLPPRRGHINSENKPYKATVNGVLHSSGPSRPPYSSSSSLSRLGLSARASLSSSSSSSFPQSLPNQRNQVRNQVGSVSPAHSHTAPPTSALKLTSLDRMPKVSTARDSGESERRLNGLSETTLPMEVT